VYRLRYFYPHRVIKHTRAQFINMLFLCVVNSWILFTNKRGSCQVCFTQTKGKARGNCTTKCATCNVFLHATTAKEEKYDRQLRLWGPHGQAALENAKIALINAGATGTEILKNLVLPGVGSFTIIDGKKVEAPDLGNNFFLEFKDLGSSRAKAATELLKELNEWVTGTAVAEDPVKLIDTNVEFFSGFTLVIATELPENALLKLSQHLYAKHIPLFVARSYGFVGYLRASVPEHTIVESHPEEPGDDLRLYEPFPALEKFCESIDVESLDSHHHGHTPYVVLLIQELLKWRAKHGGASPTTKEEKNEFKIQLRNGQKNQQEVNFNEAIALSYKVSSPTTIPSGVKEILEDPAAHNLSAHSSAFWVLVNALKKFVDHEGAGLLPLMGSIPDMTSDTQTYISLQEVYQRKAQEDVDAVSRHVAANLSAIGKSHDSISQEDIKLFCKNTLYLRLVRTTSLHHEYAKATANIDAMSSALEDPDTNLVYYFLLRAVDRFWTEKGRFPGWHDDQVKGDIAGLKHHVEALLAELGLNTSAVSENAVHEMCRFGAAELHNIAALLGGVGAQEVIKVLTHQWVPLNSTLIYNGMNSTTTVFAL